MLRSKSAERSLGPIENANIDNQQEVDYDALARLP